MQKHSAPIENVVYSIDSNYIWPFLLSLYSAQKSCKGPIKYWLALSPDSITKNEKELIETFASVFLIDLQIVEMPSMGAIPTVNHVTMAAYNKFRIPEFMNQKYLWLDSDTMCNTGWDGVFDIDISGRNIAAARTTPILGSQRLTLNAAKIRAKDNYFNSGVMLIEGGRFNENNLGSTWKNIVNLRDELHFEFNDQDVWNYLIAGQVTQLPKQFNLYADGRDADNFGLIFHFLGPKKPWHYNSNQRKFLRIVFIFAESSVNKRSVLSNLNMNCFEKYWSLEDQFFSEVQTKNPILYAKFIAIRHLSLRNHFSSALKIKIFLLSKIINFLSNSIFGR